jgi:hypothetical protein
LVNLSLKIMSGLYNSENTGPTGERVVGLRLAMVQDTNYRITVIGGTEPVIDVLIEFERNSKIYYFFAQVKSTRTGPIGKGIIKSLKVGLKKIKHEQLTNHFGPTYLVGVDLFGGSISDDEKVPKTYICTVRGEVKRGISRIPITSKHELNKENVEKLYSEVVDFWDSSRTQKKEYTSNFLRK